MLRDRERSRGDKKGRSQGDGSGYAPTPLGQTLFHEPREPLLQRRHFLTPQLPCNRQSTKSHAQALNELSSLISCALTYVVEEFGHFGR